LPANSINSYEKKIEKLNAYLYVALLWSPVTDMRILI
jgi:hypothetical protein